jgi:hypothetical protein
VIQGIQFLVPRVIQAQREYLVRRVKAVIRDRLDYQGAKGILVNVEQRDRLDQKALKVSWLFCICKSFMFRKLFVIGL